MADKIDFWDFAEVFGMDKAIRVLRYVVETEPTPEAVKLLEKIDALTEQDKRKGLQ